LIVSPGIKIPGLALFCQRVQHYQRPVWPGTSIVHLDLTAGDHVDGPADKAIALGAMLAHPQPEDRWRVLLDPAGHPFCITPFAPASNLPDD
jgi:hypothetical protein